MNTIKSDQKLLSLALPVETMVALQKIADGSSRTVEALVAQVLSSVAGTISLTADDFLAIASQVREAEKAG